MTSFQVLITKVVQAGPGKRDAGSDGETFDLEATDAMSAKKEAVCRFGHLLRAKNTMNDWGNVDIGDACLVIRRDGKRWAFIEDRKVGCVMNGGEYQWCLFC